MRNKERDTEAIIREKAIQIIVEQGFDGLSMQKLAKAAGFSVASIYIYYKNKEDMLNRLFNHVQKIFTEFLLDNFSVDLSFKDGLWLLWQNYLRFIWNNPIYNKFHDLFRNSHLINHSEIEVSVFRESIKHFARNAIKNGEIDRMEAEIFWSVAFGPFMSLVVFHFEENPHGKKHFLISEEKLKKAFEMVMKAFVPK